LIDNHNAVLDKNREDYKQKEDRLGLKCPEGSSPCRGKVQVILYHFTNFSDVRRLHVDFSLGIQPVYNFSPSMSRIE
jgi:hypothetical protein